MEASSKTTGALARLAHSFSIKLFLLALVLLAVPIILYWQFQRAEHQEFEILRSAAGKRGRAIAAVLEPHFAAFRNESPVELREALSAAAVDNVHVKVLVRLRGAKPDDFIYVASAPPFSANYLQEERRTLVRSGLLQRLAPTCNRPTDLSLRFANPAGEMEVLTSMTPMHIAGACWIVITSQSAAELVPGPLTPSFWTIPAMRIAAAIYVLSAVLVIGLFVQMWRNVSRFRSAARRIRMRGPGAASFYDLNTIPELSRVAEDFDSLVSALTASQSIIKEIAEENAHALKAPLAVIAQSIEPLKRAAASDTAAQRSVQLIERSVAKLDSLVSERRDLERAAAELVFPERRIVDLSHFVSQELCEYEVSVTAQGKRLATSVEDGVKAYANEELLGPIIENLVENAVSFTPKGGTVEVILKKLGPVAEIRVADRGPGVDEGKLVNIFDRYVSFRSGSGEGDGASSHHQGLGLWIVKRNVDALGGRVTGRNRPGGGFEIAVGLNLSR